MQQTEKSVRYFSVKNDNQKDVIFLRQNRDDSIPVATDTLLLKQQPRYLINLRT